MNGIAFQRGMTLTSVIAVLALVVFFAIIGMKLFPVYSEYYSVVQAMESVANQPGISQDTPGEVRAAVIRQFDVGYVKSVKKTNIKIARSNGYKMRIKYEVREPLMFNLDFVAKFEKTVDLTG